MTIFLETRRAATRNFVEEIRILIRIAMFTPFSNLDQIEIFGSYTPPNSQLYIGAASYRWEFLEY
jgi:hypothetical protein